MSRTRPTYLIPPLGLLLLAAAARGGPPAVAYLGIAARPADAAASAAAGLPEGVGLTVTFVEPGGPAAGGVVAGDLLHKLDDQLLVNAAQMVTLVRLHRPGDAVGLTVIRDGHPVHVTIRLGERPRPAAAPPQASDDDRIPTLPGVVGPDPATGRLPDDPQLPLPGNGRTTVAFDDGTYSARVSTDAAGHKQMVVKDADGNPVASGPVDTAEQWVAFPADVRQHLQAVQALLNGKRHPPAHTSGHHAGPAATRP